MAIVVAKISDLRVSEYAEYTKNLIAFFQGSSTYDDAGERLQNLEEAFTALETAQSGLQAMQQRVSDYQSDLNQARSEIRAVVSRLVNSVNDTAKGKVELLQKSPFRLKSDARPVTRPERVKALSAKSSGSGGRVELRWMPISNANRYVVEYTATPNDDSSWKVHPHNPTGARVNLILKLGIGIDEEGISRRNAPLISFRVAALNRDLQGEWSQVAAAYIVR